MRNGIDLITIHHFFINNILRVLCARNDSTIQTAWHRDQVLVGNEEGRPQNGLVKAFHSFTQPLSGDLISFVFPSSVQVK